MIPLGLRLALRHLTILPLRWDPAEATAPPAQALPWFPAVGAVVGAAAAVVLALPFPPLPRAALALAVWIALTGALHEDGLMDVADAAFAPVAKERRLEILEDPRAGAFAVTTEGLALLLRFGALTTVSAAAPVLAAVVGRWVMTLSLVLWRPARADGLGARFASGAGAAAPTVVALGLIGGVAWLARDGIGRAPVAAAAAAGVGAGLAAAGWLARRFGGLTGDAHGAAAVVAESAALLACTWPR